MKLKKKVKRNIIIVLVLLVSIIVGIVSFKLLVPKDKQELKEYKVLDKLDKYGYQLKENKTKKYKTMFNELKEILNAKEVDEEKYVQKISTMFVYDFYSLEDKNAKTDVGGVDFVYQFVQRIIGTYPLGSPESQTFYKYKWDFRSICESLRWDNYNKLSMTKKKALISDIKAEFKSDDIN